MTDFHHGVLELDLANEVDRITGFLKEQTFSVFNKRGIVVSVSGGIDSSLTAALAVKAVGPERVLTLCLPEKDSSSKSSRLGKMLADHLGCENITEDITAVLEAFGCYRHRDEAIKRVFPEYDSSYKMKIILPQNLINTGRANIYSVVIEDPSGERKAARLPLRELLEIVAATNHKQRTRKQYEYFHADARAYVVAGTPNRLEYDQGFFVKGGDGLADVKPIAHLYKTQVYMMARYLELPEEILSQLPTTDTYSLGQSQEEFYFSLPYDKLDLVLWAYNHDIPTGQVADVMGFTPEQISFVYNDIKQKRKTTAYLHKTLFVEPIKGISASLA